MFDPIQTQRVISSKKPSLDIFMSNPMDMENQKGLDKYKYDNYQPNYSCPVKKTRWGVMSEHVIDAFAGLIKLSNIHPQV
jgi:hypothetical protein